MPSWQCACGGDSIVLDSRCTEGQLRRRRKCRDCGARWTTYEIGSEKYHAISTDDRRKKIIKELEIAMRLLQGSREQDEFNERI